MTRYENKVLAKHTPGPWHVSDFGLEAYATHSICPADENLPIICGCQGDDLANARLMAAAPELYELLKERVADIMENETPHVGRSICARELALFARIEGD